MKINILPIVALVAVTSALFVQESLSQAANCGNTTTPCAAVLCNNVTETVHVAVGVAGAGQNLLKGGPCGHINGGGVNCPNFLGSAGFADSGACPAPPPPGN